ncbi:MAG: PIN domain-containing protein [Thermoanaerobaculia bacterium]
MRQIVVDANVFLSFLVERNEKQRAAAKALIDDAGNGEIVAIVTQFAVFEVSYVLQSFYGMPVSQVATLVREMIALPGVIVIDDCPWKNVFAYWPERLPGMADAATAAVAVANRYDAVATFDQKMVKRMKSLGIESYW